MKHPITASAAALVVAVLTSLGASPAMAHGQGHMRGTGYEQHAQGFGPCPAAPGMMGHGMMGQGMGHGMMGQGMGPGVMGQGMGHGMTGQGMGHGMMGQGMGHGMTGQGMGHGMMGPALRDRDLTVDDVKAMLEHRLAHHGNERLRVGNVEAKDDDVIVADVETVDGSLVERYAVNRHTGHMQRAQ